MLSLAAAWLLFPAVLLAVSAGLGLAVDRIVGRHLPGTLILPLGMAGAIAVARLVTSADATAELALPLLLLIALAGFVLGRDRLAATWSERHALVAAGLVFAVVGAPAYMSLEPTFLGYLQLPDTGHQLSIASFTPDGGTDYEKLEPSSYRDVLAKYIGTEYPIAPQATLGVLAPLGAGLDIAWLYHPFLAVLLAMGALSIYTLASAVTSRLLRAGVAFAGASSALVYSFALQGSIKEVAALAMLLATTAAAADLITERRPARGLFAVLLPAVAMLGSLGPAAGAYLAPVLAVVVLVAVVRVIRGRRWREAVALLVAVVAAVGLAAPVLDGIKRAYNINTGTLDKGESDPGSQLGNLADPLEFEQAAGIWLSTDYRWEPRDSDVRTAQTWLSIFIAIVAALGLAWAAWRRAWGPLLLLAALGPTSLLLLDRGSAYADAKVLALLSSLAMVFAMLGATFVAGWKKAAGYVLAAVVLGLLVVSQALTYHDAHPAPYERFAELLDVNDKLADHESTLMVEYDEFGQYFLRDATSYSQPEWAHGYREDHRDPTGLSDPDHRPSLKTPLDIDDLTNEYVQSVDAIVRRQSPVMSRPPINFERTWEGEYYEIWERGDDQVTAHLPLGRNVFEPSEVPRCSEVRAIADEARRAGGVLVAPPRPRMAVFVPGSAPPSKSWIPYALYPGAVVLDSAGAVGPAITMPEGGEYRVWVEGSFGRPVTTRVNEVAIGEIEYELGNPGQYFPVAEVSMERGVNAVRVEQAGGDILPGNGGALAGLRHLGPVVFSPPENEEVEILERDPDDWRSLCGQRLDWIEVVVADS